MESGEIVKTNPMKSSEIVKTNPVKSDRWPHVGDDLCEKTHFLLRNMHVSFMSVGISSQIISGRKMSTKAVLLYYSFRVYLCFQSSYLILK